MSDGSEQGVGALALRLVALLLVTGAAVFGVFSVAVSRLPHAGVGGYRLPGGAGTLDPAALTVLSVCSGVLGLSGVAAVLLSSDPPRAFTGWRPRLSAARSMIVLVLGVLALAGAAAVRWSGW